MVAPNPGRRARRLAKRGGALLQVDPIEALDLLVEATGLDPALHEAWFDLGLLHKWAGSWDDAFACTLRAAELVGERADEPAWWNLGIAATALRRWDVARRAWRAYGLPVPDGEGPIDGDFGLGGVRLNPRGHTEVVWGTRLDPARLRIESIPVPASGHRWGDIVLHDGVPSTTRQVDGRTLHVFDELERWEASETATVHATVSAAPGGVDALLDALADAGYAVENWTTSTSTVSGGRGLRPRKLPNPQAPAAAQECAIGVAAPLETVRTIVAAWERSHGGRCHHLAAE